MTLPCSRLLLAPLLAALSAAPAAAAPIARPAPDPVVRLEASPPALHLAGREAFERVWVTAIMRSGARRDVTGAAVLTVQGAAARAAGGVVTAPGDGMARLVVRYAGRETGVPVRVTGAAHERPVSFRYEVLPALSRAGCSQGACHGNAEGRGGFKLSLKGEDPETDYLVIARHGAGRRVNRTDPGRSLLLLKALSAVPHGGGRRFDERSDAFRTLAAWIAAGAADDAPDAPRLARLEVAPREAVLVEPARLQRLTVRAHFTDGTVRSVADRVVYNTGDPNVEVAEDGLVTARRSTDAPILVQFADQKETVRLTFVSARPEYAWRPRPAYNFIDTLNDSRLRTLRLEPSELCTDTEFLRRSFLDLLGVLPTAAEARAFQAECREETGGVPGRSARLTRTRLVERLLDRPEFDDFWTMKWCDVLRVEERTLDPRGVLAYRDWIRTSLAERKPLDQFARELLTGVGSTYANPPTNYYRRTRTAPELAETTAQVFMGVRLLCARCHDHPFERWKQDDYYSLAAFFSRVDRKIENVTRRDRFDLHERIGEEMISVARAGDVEHPRTGRMMAPALPDRIVPASFGGHLRAADGPEVDRRLPFARWLTSPDNPYFARAMVNRIWYHVVGRGLVDPVDDLRESNPPANPALLDALARDFVAHRYDLRHVVRTIMNSRTYQHSAAPNRTNAEDERFFSRAVAQRLPAEVLLDALSQVTEAPETFSGFPAGSRAVQASIQRARHPFLKLFGQPARESVCDCERSGETTLAQSFALISGGIVDAKLKQPDNLLGRLLGAGRSDAEIVGEMYLAAVSREPTPAETANALRYVRGKKERRAALEDVLWALLNGKEFLLRR